MPVERREAVNLMSELVRLVKTRDYDSFLKSLNYYQKMKELNGRIQRPEFKMRVEDMKKLMFSSQGVPKILAGKDGQVYLLRK